MLVVAMPLHPPPPAAAAETCATAPITNFLAADATQARRHQPIFFGAQGASVEFFECVDGELRQLGRRPAPPDDGDDLLEATTWDCDRATRAASSRARRCPTAARRRRLQPCARARARARFEIARPAPRRPPGPQSRACGSSTAGGSAASGRACASRRRAAKRAARLGFKQAVTIGTRRFRRERRGRWRIELRVRGHRMRAHGHRRRRRRVRRARRRRARDRRLDDAGRRQLPRRRARRRGHGAQRHPRRHRRSASPMAGDRRVAGHALRAEHHRHIARRQRGIPAADAGRRSPTCCDEQWIAEYVRRVRTMMRTYLRGGRARVLWLTLPLPRGTTRLPITTRSTRRSCERPTGSTGSASCGWTCSSRPTASAR